MISNPKPFGHARVSCHTEMSRNLRIAKAKLDIICFECDPRCTYLTLIAVPKIPILRYGILYYSNNVISTQRYPQYNCNFVTLQLIINSIELLSFVNSI